MSQTQRSFILLPLTLLLASLSLGQVSVLTQHNDNSRTGQNLQETILNTSTVNVGNFGKLFSLPVDSNIYVQPLYVPDLTIGGAAHNVVYVATAQNSVYAFDADNGNTNPLWKVKSWDAGAGAGHLFDRSRRVSLHGCDSGDRHRGHAGHRRGQSNNLCGREYQGHQQ